jgi:hypothetical protein
MGIIILSVFLIILWAIRQNSKEENERELRRKQSPVYHQVGARVLEALERKAIAEPPLVAVPVRNFDWDYFEAFISDLKTKYTSICEDPSYEAFETIELIKRQREIEKAAVAVCA